MEYLAVFPPAVAFLIAGLLGHHIKDIGAQFVTCFGVILSCLASLYLFHDVIIGEAPRTIFIAKWFSSGLLNVDWSLRFDSLSVVMLFVVNTISAIVHLYSIGYMNGDPHKPRFMAYLSLFTFAMLILVTSDNLLQLFFGWEGVGLCSYLLIGFWNNKESANNASIKAFVVNRVGDFGLILGIMTTFLLFGSLDFQTIFLMVPEYSNTMFSFAEYEFQALNLIGIFLLVGAIGKSAQLGLHTWLPDAMEGPTPVSALIHAATMVTAGIFLIARFSPLYEYAPIALSMVCLVGALTAFLGATMALVMNDIKRVIAYSTMSQLGYMFFALGVSAYGAAMFHLFTHAFFKALLFLGAGAVIHAVSDEQDMRKMGGLWDKIPNTYLFIWIGSLALTGMPFFAGFYSKDVILEAAYADHSTLGLLAFWLGTIAAFMTGFYSLRLIILTFHGTPRMTKSVLGKIHEAPRIMLYPLLVLSLFAITSGVIFHGGFTGSVSHEIIHVDENGTEYTSGWNREMFWADSIKVLPENDTLEDVHHVPKWVKLLPSFFGILGMALAILIYTKRIPVLVVKPLYTLLSNKYYVDKIYNALFVRSTKLLGRFFKDFADPKVIDGVGPDGMAYLSQMTGGIFSRIQTGKLYFYAFVMVLSLIALLSWFMFKGDL